jgi:hypothetical protein
VLPFAIAQGGSVFTGAHRDRIEASRGLFMNILRMDPAADQWAPRVAAILLQRWGRRIRDLRVELEGGGLVLHGWAATYYVKQLAQHAAAEAAGLPVHANAIEVV